MLLKPWIPYTDQQKQNLRELLNLLGINHNNGTSFEFLHFYNTGLTSYTLNNNLSEFKQYLAAGHGCYSETPTYNGYIEGALLALMGYIHPGIFTLLQDLFNFSDRPGTNRNDPLDEVFAGPRIAYLPKGITDLVGAPIDFQTDIDLTGQFQREIIQENKDDETVDSTDKSISIKVLRSREHPAALHIYINRKGIPTLRRILYKTLKTYLDLHVEEYKTILGEAYEPLHILYTNFCEPQENSLEIILNTLRPYFQEYLTKLNENMVSEFVQLKQGAMNKERKQKLQKDLDYWQTKYQDIIDSFTTFKQRYMEALQNSRDFHEVKYTALETFLLSIKNSPTTKSFYMNNNKELYFLIEEPILHTDAKVWQKYLDNDYSYISNTINNFVNRQSTKDLFDVYDTDLLKKALIKLFTDLFINKTVKIFTSALLYISGKGSSFSIEKARLPDNSYFPQPHIGADSLTCWGEATTAIANAILDNDGDTAFLQLKYALQQMSADDHIVARCFTESILNSNYRSTPVYLKKDTTERISFKTLFKEYLENEINKTKSELTSTC